MDEDRPGAAPVAIISYSLWQRRYGGELSAIGRPLVFEGIVSLIVGVITLLWPRISAFALVMFIAAWSIVTGIAEVLAAIRLRKHIRGEWLLALSGILSLALGVLLFLAPAAGALVLTIWIGAYAVVFGAVMVGLSLRLRSWASNHPQLPGGDFAHHPA